MMNNSIIEMINYTITYYNANINKIYMFKVKIEDNNL